MVQRYRRGFTTRERTEMWDRWQRGESLRAIGRAFGKPSSSIYFQISPLGGIRRPPRRRSRLKVTSKDTQTVVSALTRHAKKLPTELYKSLTWDRGKELAAHQQ